MPKDRCVAKGPVLRRLTSQLFDYAGMYPPESLSFESALETALAFRATLGDPNIIHADLVLDVPNLNILRTTRLPQSLRVALLGPPYHQLESLTTVLEGGRLIPQISIVSVEIRVATAAALGDDLRQPLQMLDALLPGAALIMLEPDLSGRDWEEVLFNLLAAIDNTSAPLRSPLALKIRIRGSAGSGTSGISPERVAAAIVHTAARNISLKATAALHCPFARFAGGPNEIGFIGLLAAYYLARFHGSAFAPHALECLLEESAAAFSFEHGLRWRQFTIDQSAINIDRARAPQLIIGSCNLHEPDRALRAI